MDEVDFENKLNELVLEFGRVPISQHRKSVQLIKQIQENRKKFEKSLDSLRDSLDYLRVCIKYQVFDLEATRRENQFLRKLLKNIEDGIEE